MQWPALALTTSAQAAPPAHDDAEAIANAESAAPTVVAQDATIMGWDDDGMPSVLLREGTNGWSCLTDWPVSPGNDPACYDAVFMAWNEAMMAGEEPASEGTGIAYMLAGGSDPSNTDPFAMEPAAGEEWISTPPHLIIVTPGGFDANIFTTDHGSGYPYIMWDGTPYEHIMIPVADMPAMEMDEMQGDAALADVTAPDTELMVAEAVEHELGTFDLYINRDWAALDATTGADYFGVAIDGSYIECDAMMAGLQDEKLTVLPPDLGEIRVLLITPKAYMVTYPLNFNGSYDGAAFSNPRTVSSLWVKRDGTWQNIFLAEQERTAPLHATDNMSPTVMLPNGFEPEGITVGRDATAYVGSVGSGAIYQVT